MRSGQYVTKRILRLTASPHAVAAGVAAGVFTSCLPFLGLHFLISFLLATILRGNLIAAALGTFFGNPLTFPFIWATSYEIGHRILGNAVNAEAGAGLGKIMKNTVSSAFSLDMVQMWAAVESVWEPVLYPMLIGGALIGSLVGLPAYFLTKRAATLFREARRDKLMTKAQELRDQAKAAAEKQNSISEAT